MRSSRLVARVTVMALLVVACGTSATTNEESTRLATSIIDAVDDAVDRAAPAPGLVVPDGCDLEQTLDEYGFAVEIVVCPEGDPTTPTAPDTPQTIAEYVGSTEARRLTVALRNALVIDGGCDTSSIVVLESEAASAPVVIRDLVGLVTGDLAAAAIACGNDDEEWARSLTSAAISLEELVATLQLEVESG